MRHAGRHLSPFTFLAALATSGCVYTTVGTKLPPIAPPRPAFQPSVEYTIGDFSYTLEGGKMVTSNFAGRVVTGAIMDAWKERDYIRDAAYTESAAFSGKADYTLSLSGSQYGESSIAMQILCGLTLFLLPSTTTQHYDLQYTLVDAHSGKRYSAGVQESNKVYTELFLIFALPFGQRGQRETMARMGDHLYDQFYRQGAFRSPVGSLDQLPNMDRTAFASAPVDGSRRHSGRSPVAARVDWSRL